MSWRNAARCPAGGGVARHGVPECGRAANRTALFGANWRRARWSARCGRRSPRPPRRARRRFSWSAPAGPAPRTGPGRGGSPQPAEHRPAAPTLHDLPGGNRRPGGRRRRRRRPARRRVRPAGPGSTAWPWTGTLRPENHAHRPTLLPACHARARMAGRSSTRPPHQGTRRSGYRDPRFGVTPRVGEGPGRSRFGQAPRRQHRTTRATPRRGRQLGAAARWLAESAGRDRERRQACPVPRGDRAGPPHGEGGPASPRGAAPRFSRPESVA